MKRIFVIAVVAGFLGGSVHAMQQKQSSQQLEYSFVKAGNYEHKNVDFATISPDGKALLTTSHGGWKAPYRGTIMLKHIDSREEPVCFEHRSSEMLAAFSSDSKRAAVSSRYHANNGALIILDVVKGKIEKEIPTNDKGWHFLSFASGDTKVITVGYSSVHIFNSDTGEIERKIDEYSDNIGICFFKENVLMALLHNGVIKSVDLGTLKDLPDITCLDAPKAWDSWVGSASALGNRVVIVGEADDVNVYDAQTGHKIVKMPMGRVSDFHNRYHVRRTGLSSSGDTLVLGLQGNRGEKAMVAIADIKGCSGIHTFNLEICFKEDGLLSPINAPAIKLSPDDRSMLVEPGDWNCTGPAVIYDVQTGEKKFEFEGGEKNSTYGLFSPNGEYVVAASDGIVQIARRIIAQSLQASGPSEPARASQADEDDKPVQSGGSQSLQLVEVTWGSRVRNLTRRLIASLQFSK